MVSKGYPTIIPAHPETNDKVLMNKSVVCSTTKKDVILLTKVNEKIPDIILLYARELTVKIHQIHLIPNPIRLLRHSITDYFYQRECM